MSKVKKKESSFAEDKGEECDYSAFKSGLDELTGAQIFEIFTNQQNFLELCSISNNFPNTMNRFCWRLKYILGETFLDIQRQLSHNAYLENSFLLDSSDVHDLGTNIIERGKTINQSKEFEKFKKVLQTAYNSGSCDENTLISIYGFCMKIWKPPITFQMDLSFSQNFGNKQKIESQQYKKSVNSKPPAYHTNLLQAKKITKTPMAPQQSSENFIEPDPKSIRKLNQNHLYKSVDVSPDDQQINLNDGKDEMRPAKCTNRNWTLKQQQFFCRMYIQCETHEAVKTQLQKKYSVDARWSNAKQIEHKINALTAKVFKKFISLDTMNPNIIKFRQLKSFVLSSDRIKPRDRAILNKIFATLYEAMLNVDEKKKAIISNNIFEVINICQRIQKNQ